MPIVVLNFVLLYFWFPVIAISKSLMYMLKSVGALGNPIFQISNWGEGALPTPFNPNITPMNIFIYEIKHWAPYSQFIHFLQHPVSPNHIIGFFDIYKDWDHLVALRENPINFGLEPYKVVVGGKVFPKPALKRCY